MPEQAEHAAANFFRKGNLIALRELALRRTADRVDAQAREYREDAAIAGVLATQGPAAGRRRSWRACRAGGARRATPRRQPARRMDRRYVETPGAAAPARRRPRADPAGVAPRAGARRRNRDAAGPGRRRVRCSSTRASATPARSCSGARAQPRGSEPACADAVRRRWAGALSGVDLLVVGGEERQEQAGSTVEIARGLRERALARLHRCVRSAS